MKDVKNKCGGRTGGCSITDYILPTGGIIIPINCSTGALLPEVPGERHDISGMAQPNGVSFLAA